MESESNNVKEKMKKPAISKEIIIGAISVLSMALLYFGVNYLKGINLFNPTNYYYVSYENVTDLTPSNSVYVDGFKVGLVHNILYNYNQTGGKIVVVLDLDKSLKIPEGSKAELAVTMLGTASINLKLNKYVSSYYASGDTLEGIPANGLMQKMEQELLPQIGQILPRIDSILTSLQEIVSHPALKETLSNMEITTRGLASSSKKLDNMLTNDVPTIMKDFKTVSGNLVSVSNQFAQLDVAGTMATIKSTITNLNTLTENLNSPNGTLGLLMNDRKLYDNLTSTANSADVLLKDLKSNPKRYVHFSLFGKKEKENK